MEQNGSATATKPRASDAYLAKMRARAAEVSLESRQRVTLPVTKLEIDVRAINESQRAAAIKHAESDNRAFMHAVVTSAAYEPDTDGLVFVDADGQPDLDALGALPPADVDALFQAALRVLAYDKPTADALKND